jgi:hypothetical protein
MSLLCLAFSAQYMQKLVRVVIATYDNVCNTALSSDLETATNGMMSPLSLLSTFDMEYPIGRSIRTKTVGISRSGIVWKVE